MEDGWMGKATERIFLPLIRLFLPEVVDIDLPIAGAFHNLVIVSIKKRYPGQARKVMYGLWGLMLLSLSKNIIVVDDDVNVHDYTEVVWRVTANMDPARDIEIVRGPMDDLDHATIYPRYGGKLGLDATRKWPGEGFERPWPPDIVMSEEIKRLVDAKWKDLGLD
jgi:4-hydroxy-3-polyprenylbenzoate decarboxylase